MMRTVFAAWASAAGVLLFAAAAAGRISGQGYLGILVDRRGRYSLTHLQIVLWTILVLSLITGIFIGRLAGDAVGGPLDFEIPETVLLLLGISIGSAVTARAIKSSKDIRRPTRVAASGHGDPRRLAQLFLVEEGEMADKAVDVTKFQNLWLTLILVAAYTAMAVAQLRRAGSASELTTLPTVAGTFVTLLAVSHGGYLAGKLPDQPGVPDGKLLLDLTDPDRATALRRERKLKAYAPRNKPAPDATGGAALDPSTHSL